MEYICYLSDSFLLCWRDKNGNKKPHVEIRRVHLRGCLKSFLNSDISIRMIIQIYFVELFLLRDNPTVQIYNENLICQIYFEWRIRDSNSCCLRARQEWLASYTNPPVGKLDSETRWHEYQSCIITFIWPANMYSQLDSNQRVPTTFSHLIRVRGYGSINQLVVIITIHVMHWLYVVDLPR